jgi:hypothetical protein
MLDTRLGLVSPGSCPGRSANTGRPSRYLSGLDQQIETPEAQETEIHVSWPPLRRLTSSSKSARGHLNKLGG